MEDTIFGFVAVMIGIISIVEIVGLVYILRTYCGKKEDDEDEDDWWND